MADTQPTTTRKIGTAVTAVLLGGTVVAGALVGQNTNANSLEPTAVKALQSAGITGVDVSFKGREAYLTGQGATDAQLQQAKQVVEGIYGVRWATISGGGGATPPTMTLQPSPPPTDTPTATATPEPAPSTPEPTSIEPSTPAPSETPAPAPSETSTAPTTGLTADQVSQINNTVVTFANGSYSLSAAAKQTLDAVVPLLAQSSVNVTIDGYVSLPHPAGQETADSTRRAQAVANYLEAGGVDASRITVVGDGSANPVGDNATYAGQAANRRATLTVS